MAIEPAKAGQEAKGPVILVVDDEYNARMQIRDILEHEGMVVVEAASGLEALNYFRNNPVDLVLLDIIMSGIDGFMACQEIRRLPGGVHVPVVMVTALEDAEAITQAFDAGATDFVCKPLNLLILGYRIRYWLRSGAALQALQVNQTRLFKAQEIIGFGHWERNLRNGEFQLTCRQAEIFGLSYPCSYDTLFASILTEDAAEARKTIDDACRDRANFRVQYRINLPGKGIRTIRNQGEVLRKGVSQDIYAIGILQDITDSQAAAASPGARENKCCAAFEGCPAGIALLSNESNIVSCNQYLAEIFGAPYGQCVGRNLLDTLPPGKMQQELKQALAGGDGQHLEGFYTALFNGKEVSLHVFCDRIAADLSAVVLVACCFRRGEAFS